MKVHRYEDAEIEVWMAEGPVVFLAGPTPRHHQQHIPSWRDECVKEFDRQGFKGTLLVPEFGTRPEVDRGLEWAPLWEFNGLRRADCILFWVPRTEELIGLTTNHEHGYWMGREREKVVYGRPDRHYRNHYLDVMWFADAEDRGISKPVIYNTLEGTVRAAIDMARMRCSHTVPRYKQVNPMTIRVMENPRG